jgi:enamine deaminase RidA (YjgF/YER057c/UK114 family)
MLPDRTEFEPCWPILAEAFGANPPAATMIECGLIDPKFRIEIEVTALAPETA